MTKKRLPQKLFMCWNYDCSSEPFLDHSEDPDLLAEKGTTITVGLYELKKKVRLINTTKILALKKSK
ncbi:unnamed protein product [marine sediment metagenome]|uniref:Uncharacterized protein n=1 Tax=marine sediment metagenome TaxID=412755 RepID=X1G7P0_9ZZZZ